MEDESHKDLCRDNVIITTYQCYVKKITKVKNNLTVYPTTICNIIENEKFFLSTIETF